MATGLFSAAQPAATANGTPDYWAGANTQNAYNQWLQGQNFAINNPSQNTPQGSKSTTQNADGTWSTNTTYSPQVQQQYDNYNNLNLGIQNKLGSMQSLNYGSAPAAYDLDYSNLGDMPGLSYNGIQQAPSYNTSGISAMPDASETDLNNTRDAQYAQQTQYLDPQFQQSKSDLDAKLANQGIMPGSDAYNREQNNYALQKQKAYSDARDSAILAGGAEQSRLYGLGMQSRQQGVNEALNNFNTGLQGRQEGVSEANNRFNSDMQSRQQAQNESDKLFNAGLSLRQQGVNEANTQHTSGLNDLTAQKNLNTFTAPTFQNNTPVSMSGVNYQDAINNGFNANLNLSNANAASSANTTNGLISLINGGLQNPDAISKLYQYATGLFGGG